MAITPYLAMTAGEILGSARLPERIGWMACHFSPYGSGLSNRPRVLPEGSLLILNDLVSIHGHHPEQVLAELEDTVASFRCSGVLLDFQRPGCSETARMARFLARELSCPAAVSSLYAAGCNAAVFLPPLPLGMPVQKHLAPWQDREIWLELSAETEALVLTRQGCSRIPWPEGCRESHSHERLRLHYDIRREEKQCSFVLRRTRDDLLALVEEAAPWRVTAAVGLYQELREVFAPREP